MARCQTTWREKKLAKPHRVLTRDNQLMVLAQGDVKVALSYKRAKARISILRELVDDTEARLDTALEALYAGAQATGSEGVTVQSSQVTPAFEAAFDFVMSAETVLRELLE